MEIKSHEIASVEAENVWKLIKENRYIEAKKICLESDKHGVEKKQAIFFLSYIYLSEWELDKARTCLEYLLLVEPDNYNVMTNHVLTLSRAGMLREAIVRLNAAPEKTIQSVSNMLFWLCHLYDDPAYLYENHKSYGNLFCAADNDIAVVDKQILNVGFVSADFYDHAAMNFLRPILKNKPHDINIFCYYNGNTCDSVTKEFMQYADGWQNICDVPTEKIIATIRDDNIDILIDLSGHTANNMLHVFAAKPAPLQITHIGYPQTTGLSAIDYRIVDSITDMTGDYCTEKLLKIDPCFLCYNHREYPKIRESKSGSFTFASFCRVEKISDTMIDMYAEILKRCRDSALILKAQAFKNASVRNHYSGIFEQRGIGTNRIKLLAPVGAFSEHLDLYNDVDLSLDTFPYNGTTTICESNLMGVPVLTLCGMSHQARVGASLLNACGIGYVESKKEKYIHTACAVYNNGGLPVQQRAYNRLKMLKSELCNDKKYAEKYWDAIRAAWAEKVRHKEAAYA